MTQWAQNTVFSEKCLNFPPKFDLAVPMPANRPEIRRPPGHRPWPTSVPYLHQRHPDQLITRNPATTICRRQPSLQKNQHAQRPIHTTKGPQCTPDMGNRQQNGISSRQMPSTTH